MQERSSRESACADPLTVRGAPPGPAEEPGRGLRRGAVGPVDAPRPEGSTADSRLSKFTPAHIPAPSPDRKAQDESLMWRGTSAGPAGGGRVGGRRGH